MSKVHFRILEPGERGFEDLGDQLEPAVVVGMLDGADVDVAIKPGATTGGRAIVMVRGRTPAGQDVVMILSARAWDAVQGALLGSGLISLDESVAVQKDPRTGDPVIELEP